MTGNRLSAVLLAALVVLSVAGCSGDDEPGNGTATGPTAAGSAPGGGGATPGSTASAAAPALPVLASRDTSVREIPIRVEVNGQSLRARMWLATTAEPTTWDVEVTNNDISTGTGAGCSSCARSGTSARSPATTWSSGNWCCAPR